MPSQAYPVLDSEPGERESEDLGAVEQDHTPRNGRREDDLPLQVRQNRSVDRDAEDQQRAPGDRKPDNERQLGGVKRPAWKRPGDNAAPLSARMIEARQQRT